MNSIWIASRSSTRCMRASSSASRSVISSSRSSSMDLELVRGRVAQEAPDLRAGERAHHDRSPVLGPVVALGPRVAPDLARIALVDVLGEAPVGLLGGLDRLLVLEDQALHALQRVARHELVE